ncbi:PepSY domain-containing protein [Kangiella sp. HZ709]|nr:PepSY domain-containing protein [Kangiella sp. HZ709]
MPVLLRKLHYWGSIVIALPLAIMIGAGLMLMLKKDVEWIQPSSQKGIVTNVFPKASLTELYASAKSVEQAGFTSWAELNRVDFKPNKGIVKFVSKSNWEVQIDTQTSQVLQVAKRRSDVIEAIHDGSFFADGVKLGVFLPAGIILFLLWLTGVYLLITTEIAKAKRRRRNTIT